MTQRMDVDNAFEKRAWKGKATEGNTLRKYRQNIQFDEGMIVL